MKIVAASSAAKLRLSHRVNLLALAFVLVDRARSFRALGDKHIATRFSKQAADVGAPRSIATRAPEYCSASFERRSALLPILPLLIRFPS